MQIPQEVIIRITEAAEHLHSENPERFPTVAEVRSHAKTDMNTTSLVMKDWRASKLIPNQKINESAPEAVHSIVGDLANTIWQMAKDQAEEKLRLAEEKFKEERLAAEQLREELAKACDQLQLQLDKKNEEILGLSNDLGEKIIELDHQKSKNLELKNQTEILNVRLEENSKNIFDYKNSITDLTNKNEALKAKIEITVAEVAKKDQDISTVQNDLKQVKSELELKKSNCLELTTTNDELKKAINNHIQKEVDLNNKAVVLSSNYEKEIVKITTKYEEIVKQNDYLKEVFEKLSVNNSKLPKQQGVK